MNFSWSFSLIKNQRKERKEVNIMHVGHEDVASRNNGVDDARAALQAPENHSHQQLRHTLDGREGVRLESRSDYKRTDNWMAPERLCDVGERKGPGNRPNSVGTRHEELPIHLAQEMQGSRRLQGLEDNRSSLNLEEFDRVPESLRNTLFRLQDFMDDKIGTTALYSAMQQINEFLRHVHSERAFLESALDHTKSEVEKAIEEKNMYAKKWKKTTTHLNQLRSQDNRLPQIADSEIYQSVMQLRYDIRAISVAFVDPTATELPQGSQVGTKDAPPKAPQVTSLLPEQQLQSITTVEVQTKIQSLLWAFLVQEISNQFCWALDRKDQLVQLYRYLKLATQRNTNNQTNSEMQSRPASERDIQMWKATTSALILSFRTNEDMIEIRRLSEKICEQAILQLSPIAKAVDETVAVRLREIVEQAILLDLNISQQASSIEWIYPSPQEQPVRFDPETMEMEIGETSTGRGGYIREVVAPGLKKRGKFAGEDLDTENVLMKMSVSKLSVD